MTERKPIEETSTYIKAIERFGVEKRYPDFERFVEVVAFRRYHGQRITHPHDSQGLVDHLVYDRQENTKVRVQIESKAPDPGSYGSIGERVNALRPMQQDGRNGKLRGEYGQGQTKHIVATTLRINRDKRTYKGEYQDWLKQYEFWDVDVLAGWAAADPVLATFLDPSLPNANALYREHAIEFLAFAGADGPPLLELIEEGLDDELRDFREPCLVYGPPYVGKTCWAIRQAWFWMQKHSAEEWTTFLFDASSNDPKSVDHLLFPMKHLGRCLFIVDNIHFAGSQCSNWVKALINATEKASEVGVLWIARTDAVLDTLRAQNSPEPERFAFPFKRAAQRFAKGLTGYSAWQRVIAALETRLDLQIARYFPPGTPTEDLPQPSLVETFASCVQSRVDAYEGERLGLLRKELLDPEPYDLYTLLLPFVSISLPVDESFVGSLVDRYTPALEALLRNALVSRAGDAIVGTQHPYQTRRLLSKAGEAPQAVKAMDAFQRAFPKIRSPRLATVSFLLYINREDGSEGQAKAIGRLTEHAEWAGVGGPLSSALERLLEGIPPGEVYKVTRQAQISYRKLSRTSHPEEGVAGEKGFVNRLKRSQKDWKDEYEKARDSSDGMYRERRKDTILYEIGYIDYLQEHYEKARGIFGESVDAGLELIAKAAREGRGCPNWKNAADSLLHVWVGALLERTAEMRGLLLQIVSGDGPDDGVDRLERLARELENIHGCLSRANAAPDARRQELYGRALDALRPSRPRCQVPIPLHDAPDKVVYFRRHEMNAWLHALQASYWPALFGVCDGRFQGTVPLPGGSYSPGRTSTEAPVVGLPSHLMEASRLACKVIDGHDVPDLDAELLGMCAVLRAGEAFQYFGDYILLAWRCTSCPATAEALAWYLENRVPDVGFNVLPKRALQRLIKMKRRSFSDK